MSTINRTIRFQFEDGREERADKDVRRRRNGTYYVNKNLNGQHELVDVKPVFNQYHPSEPPMYFTVEVKGEANVADKEI